MAVKWSPAEVIKAFQPYLENTIKQQSTPATTKTGLLDKLMNRVATPQNTSTNTGGTL